MGPHMILTSFASDGTDADIIDRLAGTEVVVITIPSWDPVNRGVLRSATGDGITIGDGLGYVEFAWTDIIAIHTT